MAGGKSKRSPNERNKSMKNQIALAAYEFLLLVFGTSSAHGLKHIAERRRHPLEIITWTTALLCGIMGATYLSLSTWERYQSSPTVISLERNYLDWNTTFPASTVCPLQKLDDSRIAKLAKEMFQNTSDDEMRRLFLLANATYQTFDKVEIVRNLNPNHYQRIIFDAAFNFTSSVSNSNSETSQLQPSIIEFGTCYTYNSQVAAYNSPSYWKEKKWNLLPQVSVFKGNPLEGDIFVAMMEMNSDLQVFIHSPQEIPESASKWFLSLEKHYLAVEFEALSIYSTEKTRGLSVKQRKCRFLEESNLETSPVYSYNICRSECRMRQTFKLCGCVPYFYRNIGKYRICDVAGMHCLSQYKERLVKLRDSRGKKLQCDCYPTCDEINYIIQTDSLIEWLLGTNFKYTLIKYPRSRLKRDIVFGASDLLVQFGGTVGLCLGCSILSIVEIFYFLTLRLLLFIMARIKH